jgi:hypothetical protein
LFLDKCIVASVADGLVFIVSAMILILLDLYYVLPNKHQSICDTCYNAFVQKQRRTDKEFKSTL